MFRIVLAAIGGVLRIVLTAIGAIVCCAAIVALIWAKVEGLQFFAVLEMWLATITN